MSSACPPRVEDLGGAEDLASRLDMMDHTLVDSPALRGNMVQWL